MDSGDMIDCNFMPIKEEIPDIFGDIMCDMDDIYNFNDTKLDIVDEELLLSAADGNCPFLSSAKSSESSPSSSPSSSSSDRPKSIFEQFEDSLFDVVSAAHINSSSGNINTNYQEQKIKQEKIFLTEHDDDTFASFGNISLEDVGLAAIPDDDFSAVDGTSTGYPLSSLVGNCVVKDAINRPNNNLLNDFCLDFLLEQTSLFDDNTCTTTSTSCTSSSSSSSSSSTDSSSAASSSATNSSAEDDISSSSSPSHDFKDDLLVWNSSSSSEEKTSPIQDDLSINNDEDKSTLQKLVLAVSNSDVNDHKQNNNNNDVRLSFKRMVMPIAKQDIKNNTTFVVNKLPSSTTTTITTKTTPGDSANNNNNNNNNKNNKNDNSSAGITKNGMKILIKKETTVNGNTVLIPETDRYQQVVKREELDDNATVDDSDEEPWMAMPEEDEEEEDSDLRDAEELMEEIVGGPETPQSLTESDDDFGFNNNGTTTKTDVTTGTAINNNNTNTNNNSNSVYHLQQIHYHQNWTYVQVRQQNGGNCDKYPLMTKYRGADEDLFETASYKCLPPTEVTGQVHYPASAVRIKTEVDEDDDDESPPMAVTNDNMVAVRRGRPSSSATIESAATVGNMVKRPNKMTVYDFSGEDELLVDNKNRSKKRKLSQQPSSTTTTSGKMLVALNGQRRMVSASSSRGRRIIKESSLQQRQNNNKLSEKNVYCGPPTDHDYGLSYGHSSYYRKSISAINADQLGIQTPSASEPPTDDSEDSDSSSPNVDNSFDGGSSSSSCSSSSSSNGGNNNMIVHNYNKRFVNDCISPAELLKRRLLMPPMKRGRKRKTDDKQELARQNWMISSSSKLKQDDDYSRIDRKTAVADLINKSNKTKKTAVVTTCNRGVSGRGCHQAIAKVVQYSPTSAVPRLRVCLKPSPDDEDDDDEDDFRPSSSTDFVSSNINHHHHHNNNNRGNNGRKKRPVRKSRHEKGGGGSSPNNNNNNGSSGNDSCRSYRGGKLFTPENRRLHNTNEQVRRVEMKNLFENLRRCVPSVSDQPKTAKVHILLQASVHCEELAYEDRKLMAELAEANKKRAKLSRLYDELRKQIDHLI